MKRQDVVRLSILSVLVGIVYLPTIIWMVERWTAAETYYSHGFLVPFISGYIVWRKRKELGEIKISPAREGWPFLILGITVHIISALWQVYFTSGFSLIVLLAGLILLFLGKEFFRKLLFPLSFLVFMVPLPLVVIANVSFKLKILASQIATALVNMLGVRAIRDGSVIKTIHSYLIVEDPCSGIRSLISLIALGALMAYFNNSISKTKKIILFLASVPIAILANVIRITFLSLASEIYGAKSATGIVHDVMGFLVFVLAFLGLLLVGKLLE